MSKIKPVQVNTAIAIVSGISALLGIVMYFERKKDRKTQSEILELDKTMKQIQLTKLTK